MYNIHTPSGVVTFKNESDFKNFTKEMEIVEAAGGLVLNAKGEVLMIYRRGFWDLPKGKIDLGETEAACAIREVQEETGLMKLDLGEKLQVTYHTYLAGNKTILKPSHWYRMIHLGNENTIPQTEEDITAIRWMNKAEVKAILEQTYGSIIELLEAHFLQKN